jgi:hypothetical protein
VLAEALGMKVMFMMWRQTADGKCRGRKIIKRILKDGCITLHVPETHKQKT